MLRHYFVTNDLDDLEKVERELEAEGLTEPQIHILSEKDADVAKRHLHEVEPVLRQDVVHSTEVGALIGVLAASAVLLLAYIMGWTNTAAGWLPFIFLAVVVLGFCTWEGGFIGIQTHNINFKRFQALIHKGRHVLFVDVEPEQEPSFARVIGAHPRLHAAGVGDATPHWVVRWQDKFHRFMKVMP